MRSAQADAMSTIRAEHPRPAPSIEYGEFWGFCRRRELRLQRCTDCATWRHHPRPRCPSCHGAGFEWTRASGRGTVASYTICYPPVLPAFTDKVPYNVVVIELAEGPFMVSNLVDCPNEEIRVGMPVEVVFTEIDEELILPQFRLASTPS